MPSAATLLQGNLEHVVRRQSSGQHRCRTSRVRPVQCLAKRLPKNPRNFKNYDDLREHLHSEHAGFSISNVLKWLSNNAFGASRWVQGLLHAMHCMQVCHAAAKTTSSSTHADQLPMAASLLRTNGWSRNGSLRPPACRPSWRRSQTYSR